MLLIEGIKDFTKDLINPRLLILKCTYFFLLAAVVIIWPQFTTHQKVLGLTEYQTGIFGSVVSIVTIFTPILSGVIGDKLGNYKTLMIITSAIPAVVAPLFAWVPSAMVDIPASNKSSPLAANASSSSNDSLVNTTSQVVDPDQLVVTFWLYLAVRTIYGVFQSIGFGLFEAAVMANMQNSGINYGYQRAWGTIGVIVSSYLGGVFIDLTGSYSVVFYVSSALQLLTAILMLGVKMDFKVPTTSLTKGILKYFFNPEGLLFFGAMLAAGMFIGYLETFMYRYLFELGATPILIGLTVTVGAPFELVLTLVTSYFVRRVGHAPLIMLGLLAYAIRFLGLSFLIDPWWVLPFEILESVANGLLFTAAIMYCTVLFPMETIASFRGLFATVYFGLGKLVGTLIGTEIRERLGHVTTFRIWACIALACTFIYCLSFVLLKKYRSGKFSTNHIKTARETTEKEKKTLGIDNIGYE